MPEADPHGPLEGNAMEMLPPLGVTGRPDPVIGASAREPTVTCAASADTVRVRSPAFAPAVRVAEAPLLKVRTVPLGMPAVSRSTAMLVADEAAVAAQVTMWRPSLKNTIRDVEAVPVSL